MSQSDSEAAYYLFFNSLMFVCICYNLLVYLLVCIMTV